MDTFPDLGALSDQELKDLIQQLTEEEQEVSYRRRILHGKIDILRAELVNRLRKKHEEGESVISGADVQQLTDILVRQGHPDGRRAASRTPVHCPECGFVNAEGANYCQKCGAFLGEAELGQGGRHHRGLPGRRDRRAQAGRPRGGHRRGRDARDPLRRRALGRGVPRRAASG